jgi:ssDNA-binding replication factor A large subunit
MVRVIMTNWGEMVSENTDNLRIIESEWDNLRLKITHDIKAMRKYKDRLEGRVVGDSLRGWRKMTVKMKQTIRFKLDMVKRSSIKLTAL